MQIHFNLFAGAALARRAAGLLALFRDGALMALRAARPRCPRVSISDGTIIIEEV